MEIVFRLLDKISGRLGTILDAVMGKKLDGTDTASWILERVG